MKKIIFLLAMISSSQSVRAEEILRVLTYESFLGAQGLAPILQKKFRENCKQKISQTCDLEFMKVGELTGLVGRLRLDRRTRAKISYRLVVGLDQYAYAEAQSEGLVEAGRVYDESPFSIIVDRQKFPEKNWPRSWKELSSKMKGAILVPDPRTSTLGAAWIRVINELKLIEKDQAQVAVKRVFPSWTSAYSAFLQGEGAAVWSFQTSEAYHRCGEDKAKSPSRYVALPLEEGYPVHREYVARVKRAEAAQDSKNMKVLEDLFVRLISEDSEIQQMIFQSQWMYPVDKKAKAPECFKEITRVKSLDPVEAVEPKQLRRWIDEWTL